LPTLETTERWNSIVPQTFTFAVKMWQEITHDTKEIDLDSKLYQFFYRMDPLKQKICAILLQFPPWFKYSENHLNYLLSIINESPLDYKLFLELRHNNWFNIDILSKLIDNSRTFLGTTYFKDINPYYFPNQNSYYIRLIGDRLLESFGSVQRTQDKIIAELGERLNAFENSSNIDDIFIIVNNHFTGFSPETVNNLKKIWKLPTHKYDKQKRLTDYF
jgi:uncharacterized protein YecE (DUF72 family)